MTKAQTNKIVNAKRMIFTYQPTMGRFVSKEVPMFDKPTRISLAKAMKKLEA